MNTDLLEQITSSIQEKLGEENSALIADDIGQLIASNSQTLKDIESMNNKINSLTERNEKLIVANGNLLQQVPMSYESKAPKDDNSEEKKKSFSFKDCFDSRGNFKK